MFKIIDTTKGKLLSCIYSARWLKDDRRESKELFGVSIYELFKYQILDDPRYKLVYYNDKLITALAIDNANGLTYFNTEDVKTVLRPYLRFIKKEMDLWVEEEGGLYVTTYKKYKTAIKKNELLGFKPLEYYTDRIVYGKQKENN